MGDFFYTVTELTREIKRALEGNENFTGVWVRGEIYNLTYHSSGHIYFTLKDSNALIAATFFKGANRSLKFRLEEGMQVLALGSVTLFEKRGSYQLNVIQVKPDGLGELQQRIEQLKKKLLEEGLFDPSNKKPLPFLPRRIGIVTSPTGAAVRDIIKVALRRYPTIEILVAPANVQGDDAAPSIARAIEELNRPHYGLDLIIAGRGGGSFEDLMPFNEEIVVRAFAASRLPIVSAVGHQVDHPLSAEAADLAAPTPSAAAEEAVPVKSELADEINYLHQRAERALAGMMRHGATRLESLRSRRLFTEPAGLLAPFEMSLADAERGLADIMNRTMARSREKLLSLPDLSLRFARLLQDRARRFDRAAGSLEQLSPLAVMRRGYAVVMDGRKRIIRSIAETAPGSQVQVLLRDGSLACSVESIQKGDVLGKEEERTK
jgi:exodeoxyribonuclease VII large subunit